METLLIVNIILTVILLGSVMLLLFKRGASSASADSSEIRKEISLAISELGTLVTSSINATNSTLVQAISAQVEHLERQMSEFKESGASNHIAIINTLNDNFKKIIEENRKNNEASLAQLNAGLEAVRNQTKERLDAIQRVVDEKLDATLSARLKASFDNVIRQIGDVNAAVGEIKGLAKDVSSLNRVLTNVKTKGIVGEIALASIISETLTPDQYDTNVVTKAGTHDPVEFAVKMPGKDDELVYLPIDAKFPLEAYHEMKDASEALDKVKYDNARKSLRSTLKQFAKKIHDKYIDPPATTDFAIMFLPIEGLYIEALDMGLFEELQREYKVSITGPSTLTALLNALQMGFKSLVIQKRTSQVFELLGAVKAEFKKFGEVLAKAQRKFDEANEELERLVGTRTRRINARLREITELDELSAETILNPQGDEDDDS